MKKKFRCSRCGHLMSSGRAHANKHSDVVQPRGLAYLRKRKETGVPIPPGSFIVHHRPEGGYLPSHG